MKKLTNITEKERKVKLSSTCEEMNCDVCKVTTGHLLKPKKPKGKSWTCAICGNQK